MSKKSWLKAFYPKPVEKGLTDLEQLDRDILKWSGCNESSLRAHGVTFFRGGVKSSEGEVLVFDAASCYCCTIAYRCNKCPIKIYTRSSCYPSYNMAISTGNVGPMLKQLRQARRNLLKELKTRDG